MRSMCSSYLLCSSKQPLHLQHRYSSVIEDELNPAGGLHAVHSIAANELFVRSGLQSACLNRAVLYGEGGMGRQVGCRERMGDSSLPAAASACVSAQYLHFLAEQRQSKRACVLCRTCR